MQDINIVMLVIIVIHIVKNKFNLNNHAQMIINALIIVYVIWENVLIIILLKIILRLIIQRHVIMDILIQIMELAKMDLIV